MVGATEDLLLPLLRSLTALEFMARYLDPLVIDAVMERIGNADAPLRDVRSAVAPNADDEVATHLTVATDAALAAFDAIRAAFRDGDDLYALFRALRYLPRAQEALYPLAHRFEAANSFFVDPALRGDAAALAARAVPPRSSETGVMHVGNEPGSRGGFSLYVPETYSSDRAWPLVMALHGGSGNGRGFLWNWLRDARSHDAILVAPTATGRTWALTGEDTDTPNLNRILDHVAERWRIDPSRVLLAGMSDGGTFCYVSGLERASRVTHLAPACATFHPMLAAMADRERISGLPIFLVHGARDWMFPVEIARRARQALSEAGADVSYREFDDLSHCYPREVNAELLSWMTRAS